MAVLVKAVPRAVLLTGDRHPDGLCELYAGLEARLNFQLAVRERGSCSSWSRENDPREYITVVKVHTRR